MLVSVCITHGKQVNWAARTLDVSSGWCSCTRQACNANSDNLMGDTQVNSEPFKVKQLPASRSVRMHAAFAYSSGVCNWAKSVLAVR